MTHIVHPILLAGGSGTRLWPLSRKSYPKQFAKLMGEESLFQASAQRLSREGFPAPVIQTGSDLFYRDRAIGGGRDCACGHSY